MFKMLTNSLLYRELYLLEKIKSGEASWLLIWLMNCCGVMHKTLLESLVYRDLLLRKEAGFWRSTMAVRATVTLRDKDYELLDQLKKALDLPTSQALGVAIRIADIVREEQAKNKKLIFRDQNGSEETIMSVDFARQNPKP